MTWRTPRIYNGGAARQRKRGIHSNAREQSKTHAGTRRGCCRYLRENPPSHPQLLRLLADEFVAMKYDVRAYIKQLALSKTYQRSIDFPIDARDTASAREVLNSFAKRKTELEIDCSQFSREVSRFGQALARERQNVTQVTTSSRPKKTYCWRSSINTSRCCTPV